MQRSRTHSRSRGRPRFCGLAAFTLASLILAALPSFAAPAVRSSAAPDERAAFTRSPFVAVAQRVGPAVVNIRTTRSVTQGQVDEGPLQEMFRQFFPQGESPGGPRFDRSGSGSGFVISPEGLILTNHHVVAGADAVTVRFSGERREHPAQVLGTDPNTDLALLKIDPPRPLVPLEFGDSDDIAIGDWAIAIGNPFGNLEGSLTVGVISAKGRSDLVIAGSTPRYQDFIQTDASINFGNSGGPLVDIAGRVIGINAAVNTGGQGIGFAIPANLARRVAAQIREHGRVVRAWLGVRAIAVPEPAAGALVTAVLPDSPAASAGLAVNDVIVEICGRAVADERDLQFLAAEAPVGREAVCVIVRAGERRRVTVTPTELPAAALVDRRPDPAGGWLGLEVASLADPSPRVSRLKEALGAPDGPGVIVVGVEPAGPAAAAGIRSGDVLLAVEGQPIAGLDDWRRARDRAMGQEGPLELLVRTGTQESYVRVQPGKAGTVQ